jgi:tetratricopeptide (TPR) repeat protein/tRNA A-37 threonylcarbamoyl transferase component Bud32
MPEPQPLPATSPAPDSPPPSTVPYGPPAAASTPPPASADRYTAVRFHARGGLGEVFVARDEELHREVALKRIRADRPLDDDGLRRFLREAEVTARLEHPGVAPVYGLVRDADGRPCYAMRFIAGESLQEALERFHRDEARDPLRRGPALRRLLARFATVCQTVAYAHSKGVIHRDLKPQNILLGPYGETLVVDWGLAKVLDQPEAGPDPAPPGPSGGGSGETATGQAMGTPAYMSPEQAQGDWAVVKPASDVYSLGATLYALLTGEPPARGSVTEVLEQVKEGRLTPPRQAQPWTPPALDAVCRKAMSRHSWDRYAAAAELAADVERWLADEPTTAYREPWPTRVARWGRRHKTWVAGAAALLLTATAALAVGLVVVGGKEREAAAARDQAQKNEAEARTAQQQATAQSQLAVQTLAGVVSGFQREVAGLPAARPFRRRTLAVALEKLRQVSRSAATADAIDRATMLAHLEIGNIFLTAGGDSPDEAAAADREELRGWTAEADWHFEQALKIAQRLADAVPKDLDARHDLAVCHSRRADALERLNDVDGAEPHRREALTIRRELVEKEPNRTDWRRELAVVSRKKGEWLLRQGKAAAAIADLDEAVGQMRAVVRDKPKMALYRRDLALCLVALGEARRRLGEVKEAKAAFDEALKVRQETVDALPSDALAQADLALSLQDRGRERAEQGDAAGARRDFEKALKICRRLAADDPSHRTARLGMAVPLLRLGELSLKQNDPKAADALLEEAETICRGLAGADPDDAEARRNLATAREKRGDARLALKDLNGAGAAYAEATALCRELARDGRGGALARRDLAVCCRKLGDVRLALGDVDGARRAHEEARDLRQKLSDDDPKDAVARLDLTESWVRLGNVEQRAYRYSEAVKRYDSALALLAELQKQGKGGAEYPRLKKGLQESRDFCEIAAQVGDDPACIRNLPPSQQPQLYVAQAGVLLNGGKVAAAAADAEALAALKPAAPDNQYKAGCILARCAAAVAPRRWFTGRTAEQLAQYEKYAARGVELVGQAAKAGGYLDDLRSDPDLKAVRGRADFQKALQEAERKGR